MNEQSAKRNFRSDDIERPIASPPSAKAWGSDGVAAVLGAIDIPYIALNPGASYRGFHDSLVNYLGNKAPQMLLCLHEEHAVAIAHGYAKVTGKPMAAAVHSNVGLMHATMAIFNAWCDRMPVIVFGATGPVDAAKRRPWIDWLHTTQDQAAMIRNFIKWDAQPASVGAAQEALLRANLIARTAPRGPVYINLDVGLQEQEVELPPLPDVSRYAPPPSPAPGADQLKVAADLLIGAKKPVMLIGRVGHSEAGWKARIELAEAIRGPGCHRRQARCGVPEHPSAACRRPNWFPLARRREADFRSGRDSQSRLDRPWRHAQGGLRRQACHGQGDSDFTGPACAYRLEHGAFRIAAG
jgi:acetolactate synthase-1/2/3 large subunit